MEPVGELQQMITAAMNLVLMLPPQSRLTTCSAPPSCKPQHKSGKAAGACDQDQRGNQHASRGTHDVRGLLENREMRGITVTTACARDARSRVQHSSPSSPQRQQVVTTLRLRTAFLLAQVNCCSATTRRLARLASDSVPFRPGSKAVVPQV